VRTTVTAGPAQGLAEDRDAHDRPLDDEAQQHVRKRGDEADRIPGALVIGDDHVGPAGWSVLGAAHAEARVGDAEARPGEAHVAGVNARGGCAEEREGDRASGLEQQRDG
jgi:hypothetical protein